MNKIGKQKNHRLFHQVKSRKQMKTGAQIFRRLQPLKVKLKRIIGILISRRHPSQTLKKKLKTGQASKVMKKVHQPRRKHKTILLTLTKLKQTMLMKIMGKIKQLKSKTTSGNGIRLQMRNSRQLKHK